MKKYQHIITGNIATETNSENNYKVSQPRHFTIPKWIIENSNDWKEIEKEYEILSFYDIKNKKYYKNDTQLKNCFCIINGKEPFYNEDDLISNTTINIHSIKRLSDGVVFTIGDKISYMNNSNISILEKIHIVENSIYFNINNCVHINDWYLVSILFTTHDGVNIYDENISVYRISKKLIDVNIYVDYAKYWNNQVDKLSYLCFSTKEKAKEYIDFNKKSYSLNDLKEISKNLMGSIEFEKSEFYQKLIQWK